MVCPCFLDPILHPTKNGCTQYIIHFPRLRIRLQLAPRVEFHPFLKLRFARVDELLYEVVKFVSGGVEVFGMVRVLRHALEARRVPGCVAGVAVDWGARLDAHGGEAPRVLVDADVGVDVGIFGPHGLVRGLEDAVGQARPRGLRGCGERSRCVQGGCGRRVHRDVGVGARVDADGRLEADLADVAEERGVAWGARGHGGTGDVHVCHSWRSKRHVSDCAHVLYTYRRGRATRFRRGAWWRVVAVVASSVV